MQDLKFEESDDEVQTWADVKDYKLRFGKHEGSTLSQVIITSAGRGYLRYLLKWDLLNDDTRAAITLALKLYKLQIKSRKKKRKRTVSFTE